MNLSPATGPTARLLSYALAIVAVPTTLATVLMDGLLLGPAVQNGSARGTAGIMLVTATVVAAATRASGRGSARAVPLWLGGLAYLVYNGFMLLLGTPFNQLFPAYVATFSLALWALLAAIRDLDLAAFDARYARPLPQRAVAAYVATVVVLNTVAWAARIVPTLGDPASAPFLEGTGLITNPVFVQDLAVWLPLAALAAGWLWRDLPRGRLAVPAILSFWVLESLGIAVDQWFGHVADPASPVASAGAVPAFAVAALVGLVPLLPFVKSLDGAAAG